MALSNVLQYDAIFEQYQNGNKNTAIADINALHVDSLTDSIRYYCERLESSNNDKERNTWRTLRHHTLNAIDVLLNIV